MYILDCTYSSDEICESFQSIVTPAINDALTRGITENDGLTARFYQRLVLGFIGPDIISEVRCFVYPTSMHSYVNKKSLCWFWLIYRNLYWSSVLLVYVTWCIRYFFFTNMMYKIISKILVFRLKPIFDSMVTESQAAFIMAAWSLIRYSLQMRLCICWSKRFS